MASTTLERSALSINEFCLRAGIGRTRAYEEIKAGRLHTVKCGSRRLVPVASEEAWLNRLTTESK